MKAGAAWFAVAAACVQLAIGGGCASSLPQVHPQADPDFLRGGAPVGSIDVLPVDVQIWAHNRSERGPEEIAEAFDQVVAGAVTTQLASRGYRIHSFGWDGRFVADTGLLTPGMAEQDVAETVYALSGYGDARARSGYAPLAPHLPHRLGGATHADATLYIGGWGFAGKKPMSTGKKVAIGIGIALVAAVIVIAVIASAKGGGGHGGGGVGGAVASAGRASGGALRVAGRVVGGVGRVMARTTLELARGVSHVDIVISDDCYGRTDTVQVARPDYYSQTRRRSGRSAMLLELTLIDNRTGQALWHARQQFALSPGRPAEVERAVTRMLASIPIAN